MERDSAISDASVAYRNKEYCTHAHACVHETKVCMHIILWSQACTYAGLPVTV